MTSRASADRVRQTLKAHDITQLVTVANGQTLTLTAAFANDPECTVIGACREGEAVAIAAGLTLGGRNAVLSMECTGLFESCDTIRGLLVTMEIPMLLFIGYFGQRSPGWEQKYAALGGMQRTVEHASAWTEPFLKAMGMPYYTLDSPGEIANLESAIQRARERSGPVAVLVEILEG